MTTAKSRGPWLRFRLALLAITLGAAPLAGARAWNDRGHMIVAAEAWEQLTPETKRAVNALLRHNPLYGSWVRGLPSASRPRAAFVRAATWPDIIKNAPGTYHDRLPSAKSARNIGYVDCYQHRYWHYKDLPFSTDGTPVSDPLSPNAETQIRLLAAGLADPSLSNDIRSYDLSWLLHLVGDVHQPLHATQRFIASDPDGDGGGNDVKYCLTSACAHGSSLHSFWDAAFGNAEDLASVVAFARALPRATGPQVDELDPATWLAESSALAQAKAYQPPVAADSLGPAILTDAYRADAAAVATRQVALAGARLASLLNGMNLEIQPQPVTAHRCPNDDD